LWAFDVGQRVGFSLRHLSEVDHQDGLAHWRGTSESSEPVCLIADQGVAFVMPRERSPREKFLAVDDAGIHWRSKTGKGSG
jgi:hypothetical protein